MNKKAFLRDFFKKIRRNISHSRRLKARNTSIQLLSQLTNYKRVLSFASFESEIDTYLINLALAQTNRLFLPKIFMNQLKIFQVDQPKAQLAPHPFGFLEPIPHKCLEIDPLSLDVILVPALAFDQVNHRLGYGRGFYDRFLEHLPGISTFGLGFHEQFFPNLPTEKTDIPLEKVCLF